MATIGQLRSVKVAGMALFDWAFTIFGAYFIWRVGTNIGWLHADTEFWHVLLGTVVLGIMTHKLLGVHTTLGHYMGLNPKPK